MATGERVAVVSQQYPPELGGNANRVGDTARQLDREGLDVTVVAPPESYPPGRYARSYRRHVHEVRDGVDLHRLWSYQPARPDPGTIERLAYYLVFAVHATLWLAYHRKRFDVVVCTTPPPFTAIPGLALAELAGVPFVVDVGDLWIDAAASLGFISEKSLSTRLTRRYEHLVLLRADRVLTTTEEMNRLLERAHGPALTRRLVVIPNAVDVERFHPDAGERSGTDSGSRPGSDATATRESTTGVEGPAIVYTGNFGHAQGLDNCVRAMARVEGEGTLLLVGDGDLRPKLERLVADLDLGDRVEIRDPIDRSAVPGLLAAADVGIATLRDTPGLRYAVPSKTYEYMACGLPVIGTDMGALGELIDESGAGLAVADDPGALASAFDELLADPERCARMGERGRAHVEAHYDRRVVARRLAETLREITIPTTEATT